MPTQAQLNQILQPRFWGKKSPGPPPAHMAMQCSPPAVCPRLPQRRPYLLLLAASSSLIFLMSLLHFSISTTFSPSTGDQEKQGGYHGYTAEDGKAGNWGLAHGSHVHWRVGRRGAWLRHWFPLPPTLLILWPPPHSAETQLPPDTRLFIAFRPVISLGWKLLPLPTP